MRRVCGPDVASQPSAVRPRPSAVRPEPSAVQPEPSAVRPKPSASAGRPQPSAVLPKPSAVQPAPSAGRPKPTVAQLGIDLAAQDWQRSGVSDGSFEVALVRTDADWVLLRVAGDPVGRVLVYDRIEWECFLDGVGRGEFDVGLE